MSLGERQNREGDGIAVIGTTEAFLDEVASLLGMDSVFRDEATLQRYAHNLLPSGDRWPGGVVLPASTEDVKAVVQLANKHRVALWPTSTGENRGMGLKSPVRPGQVVLDLGKRMNRILEVDETLAYAEVEPGVTFEQMYEELGRLGHKLMMSGTSGPPGGGILGNALDKGAGYTPYFDHFGMTCGLEVVLPDGVVLRTADGALPGNKTWHLSKYGYGPFVDGLFVQSNFGIVTKIGIWLMPRPLVIKCFFFIFPDDEDLGEIIDLTRPLKMTGTVPSLIKVTSDVYGLGTEACYPFRRTDGRTPLPDDVRRELREQYGTGAWTVSGAFYGPTEEAVRPLIERVITHYGKSQKARYVSHEQALGSRILGIHRSTFSGEPTREELNLLKWRGAVDHDTGGATWFLPSTPMIGSVANEHQFMSRRILAEFGFEYIAEHVCSSRMSRALHLIIFNRSDPEECQRAVACYRALLRAYDDAGYPIGRAPVDFQEEAMRRLHGLPQFLHQIKQSLDPNGVIAPGKYGVV